MKKNIHQIHCEVPIEFYRELKVVLPEKGMLSNVIRALLKGYLKAYKAQEHNIIERVSDKVYNTICKHCGERR